MTDPAGQPIEVHELSRQFGNTRALSRVSLTVRRGEVHALLGPNGAGKTTLLRILAGLTAPSAGTAYVVGHDVSRQATAARRVLGVIPSGDRTFYQRLSGFENLVFFARLHGFTRREAAQRAGEALEAIGLPRLERLEVGRYSQGMQKRLAIARALLIGPPVLLVDEATHNLDPEGARRVRALVRGAADRGAGVLWATQRVDEIRDFADTVTLLHQGSVRFTGTPAQLVSVTAPKSFLIRIRNGSVPADRLAAALKAAVRPFGLIVPDRSQDGEHFILTVGQDATLGEAVTALIEADVQILSCHESRSEIEQAFLVLTEASFS